MSIINRPPEMVKREYELQEPIAVAVKKYATFIQGTPDYVVSSALFSRWPVCTHPCLAMIESTISIPYLLGLPL